jgi:hypothetical protein
MFPFVQEKERIEIFTHQDAREKKDEHAPHQWQLVKWTRILAITTGFLAVATFVVAFFAWWGSRDIARLADAATDQADIAKRTFTDLERPYVFVDTPAIAADDPLFNPNGNRLPNIEYRLTNFGRTPAIILWVRTVVHIPNKPEPTYSYIFNGQIVLKNGESTPTQTFSSKVWMPLIYNALQETEFTVSITYSDVFEYMHLNEFTIANWG